MQEAQLCHLCDKPAFAHVEGLGGVKLPICAQHYIELQSVENERQRQLSDQVRHNMAMMNHALASMDELSYGLSTSAKVAIPEPTPPANLTAINVTDSTVGVINTATVGQITANIGSMAQGDPARIALADITAAVAENASLSEAGKKALLDQLAVIAGEAAAEPAKRKSAVVGPLLAAISQGAGTVTALATAWSAVEPVLKAHFGLA